MNSDMANRETVNCLLNPQVVSRGTFQKLISNQVFFHFGLIDTILIMWKWDAYGVEKVTTFSKDTQ